jgi:O-antigen/teichoic acid export membrane protein
MVTDSTQHAAIRRLATSVSLYTTARMAAGAIRLFAVPIIVHAVSATAFGTLATLWTVMLVAHGISDFGLGAAAMRLAPECRSDEERRSLFGTMVAGRSIAALVVTGLLILLREPLALWATGSNENAGALLWLALARPLAMLLENLVDELRARDRMNTVSALVLLGTALVQALSVGLVVGFGLELLGLVWARAVGDVVTFAIAGALCWRFVRGRPNTLDLRRLISFGWPIGVLHLLGTLRLLDRPLIRALLSIEHVAAYELGMRLVAPVGVLNLALLMVLEPFVYRHSQSPGTAPLMDLFVRGYVAIFATTAMALAAFGHDVVTLLAPVEYHDAALVLPALAFAAACEGLQRASGIGAELAKRTRPWAVVSVVTLVIGLGLAGALVPRVGVVGAGFAWVIANATASILVYRMSRSVSGIVLPVYRALAVLIVGAVLGSAAALQVWPLPLRMVLFIGFGAASWRIMRMSWKQLKDLVPAQRSESHQ